MLLSTEILTTGRNQSGRVKWAGALSIFPFPLIIIRPQKRKPTLVSPRHLICRSFSLPDNSSCGPTPSPSLFLAHISRIPVASSCVAATPSAGVSCSRYNLLLPLALFLPHVDASCSRYYCFSLPTHLGAPSIAASSLLRLDKCWYLLIPTK